MLITVISQWIVWCLALWGLAAALLELASLVSTGGPLHSLILIARPQGPGAELQLRHLLRQARSLPPSRRGTLIFLITDDLDPQQQQMAALMARQCPRLHLCREEDLEVCSPAD
ncbi:MAG: hypothetical protein ACOX7F_02405 [Eubacteriales bacterium]